MVGKKIGGNVQTNIELPEGGFRNACLIRMSTELKEDANATASAYMEFGKQPIEAYDALRALAERYSQRKYSGAVQSEFNTMKCIDLLHSKELEALAGKWTAAPR